MQLHNKQYPVILASGSQVRATLLKNAGLEFTIYPADIDEDTIKTNYLSSPSPQMPALAETLAEHKAKAVSKIFPDHFIIGADQILVLENKIFNKPGSYEQARTQLMELRGHTHLLISAVSLVHNGENLWTCTDQCEMKMREFSPEFLDIYLHQCGKSIFSSVGGYQLENHGAHLFDTVKGDYFTVLGLPLIPLLESLRTRNILVS